MADFPEENLNDEPIEISVDRDKKEPKPEEQNVIRGDVNAPEGEGMSGQQIEGEGQNGSEGEKGQEEGGQGKGEEKEGEGEGEESGEPKQGKDGEEESDDDGESEEEKEEREQKEKEKQEKRDQEDKETKEKREEEDQKKSPDKKKKEKREKEDQETKEKRDKEDQKDKQDRRDKEDKRKKEKRDQEDEDEKKFRDQQDEKDQQEKDPKKKEEKEKRKKEKRAEQDWKKKKKREKEDQKKKERREKEDKEDSIIGKRVMLVYVGPGNLGEIFIVKKLKSTTIVDEKYISERSDRELKVGEKLPLYELESVDGSVLTMLHRIDFVLLDGGDSILWQEGGSRYTNEVKQINISEKSLAVDMPSGIYWVVVDKVIKVIPSTKSEQERREEKEKEEKEKDDGLFHPLSVVLVNDVIQIFKSKNVFPNEDTFLVCHLPRKIYSIYKKVLAQAGSNDAELIKKTGSSLADFRELDRYLAKMILKQFQIAGYYYDPEYAFETILSDNLKSLNALNSKNVLVSPDSTDTVSIFRDGKTLWVYSNVLGYSFIQDIMFGERENIIKFDLWKDHKYDKIQELYNFLEFIVQVSRLVSEGDEKILQYNEINNEIANIYNTQLKALENAI